MATGRTDVTLSGAQGANVRPAVAAASASAPAATVSTTTASGPVLYGWQLTASNTGLAGVGIDKNTFNWGTALAGNSLVANTTYTRRKITGPMDLSGKNNIVLDQCWIVNTATSDCLNFNNTVGFTMRDCTLEDQTGLSHATNHCMLRAGASRNFTIQRCYSPDAGTVAMWVDGGGGAGTQLIEDCYFIVNKGGGSVHCDGFTRRGGTQPLTLRRCRFFDSVPFQTTGAFFLQDSFNEFGTGVGGITATDCYFEGAGYPITIDGQQNQHIVSLFMNNCRTRGDVTAGGDYYGPATRYGTATINQWTQMFQYDGTRLPFADGASIPQP